MNDPRAIATAYIHAVGEGRLDDVADYLHPSMKFAGAGLPGHDGAEAYLGALRRLRPIIARNEIRTVLVEGREVCVLYDFVTDTPVGPVTSAEWLTVDDDGRITSVYLLFDKARWPEVVQQLELTAAQTG